MSKNNPPDNTLDVSVVSLSFAVELVDDYTNRKPIGNISMMSLDIPNCKPILNKSGYWIFLNQNNIKSNPENSSKTIRVSSSYYFDVIQQINLENFDDPKNPLAVIRLIPKPNYPFLNNITLIRGLINDNNKKPIKDATIILSDNDIQTTSTEKGDFVLYFVDPLKQITEENFINHNTVDISLKISHPDFKEKILSSSIKSGKTTSYTITMEAI